MILGRETLIARLTERLYGGAVIRNDVRGELVEEMIAAALAPDWEHCGGDWGACDLHHPATAWRMQVKQSAARQTWSSSDAAFRPRFSIVHKQGRWEGARWIAEAGRNAELFVFAWHDVSGAQCDHADPAQWLFHVVPEPKLPPQKSVSLAAVRRLAKPVSIDGLAEAVVALFP